MTLDDFEDGDTERVIELSEEQFERRTGLLERLLEVLTSEALTEHVEHVYHLSEEYGPLVVSGPDGPTLYQSRSAEEILAEVRPALAALRMAQAGALLLATPGELEESTIEEDFEEADHYLNLVASADRWLYRVLERHEELEPFSAAFGSGPDEMDIARARGAWAREDVAPDDESEGLEEEMRLLLGDVENDEDE